MGERHRPHPSPLQNNPPCQWQRQSPAEETRCSSSMQNAPYDKYSVLLRLAQERHILIAFSEMPKQEQ